MNKKYLLVVIIVFFSVFFLTTCELFFPERVEEEIIPTNLYTPGIDTPTDYDNLPETNAGFELAEGTYLISRESVNSNFVDKTENADGTVTFTLFNEVVVSRATKAPDVSKSIYISRSVDELGVGDAIYIEPSENGGTGFWGRVTTVVNDGVNTAITITQDTVNNFMEFIGPIVINQNLEDITLNFNKNSTGTGWAFEGAFDFSNLDDIDITLNFTDIQFFFYYSYTTNQLEYFFKYNFDGLINISSTTTVSGNVKITPPGVGLSTIVGPFTINLGPYISLEVGCTNSNTMNYSVQDCVNYHYVLEDDELVKHIDFDEYKPISVVDTAESTDTSTYLTAALGLELNALLIDCLGPFLKVEGYGTLAKERNETDRYIDEYPSLSFGINGSAGVKLVFFNTLETMGLVGGLSLSLEHNFNIAEWSIYPIEAFPESLSVEYDSDVGNNLISWEYTRDDLTQYRIQKTIDSGTYETGDNFTVSSEDLPFYLDFNVVPNNKYYYRIRGEKDGNRTFWSEEVSVETGSGDNFNIDNSIAYWPFNGNTHDQQETGDATANNEYFYVDGVKNSSIYLVGAGHTGLSGGHVLLPFIDLSEMNEFSISLWARQDGNTSSLGHGESFISFGQSSNGETIGLGYNPNSSSIFFTGISYPYSEDDIKNWNHYVITYYDDTLYGYLNGELIGNFYRPMDSMAAYAGLGCHWFLSGGTSSNRFIGAIDEVLIFDHAINENAIDTLYKLEY